MNTSACRACVAPWLGVSIALSTFVSVARAQEWFTQRTYKGSSAPVINGARDAFARPAEIVDAEGHRIAAATRDPTYGNIFPATGLPLAIPDAGAVVTSTINVPAVVGPQGVRLSFFIKHTFRKDLRVLLTAPNGTAFTLSNQEGGIGISFDILIVDQDVGVPAGFDPQGAWVLSIQDLRAGDIGQLESFSLAIPSINDSALIDLVVSLESNPAGDNNGNTQGQAGSEAQDTWERIMQHFADAIFEMTEGRHKIRQIRIFRGGKNFGEADVRWSAKGHPHTPFRGGIGVEGGHINMYETFENGEAPGRDIDFLLNEIAGGYTQAHEWGHFFYGLGDEYPKIWGDVAVVPSVMNDQFSASGGDNRHLNFSIRRVNGGDYQNTTWTPHHRQYGASGWEVLSRPAENDSTIRGLIRPLGPRIYYPELTGAAPTGTNVPRIDLPSAAARSALNITWMEVDYLTLEIVIDSSGSMAGAPMAQAKAAAQLLVNQLTLGRASVGITAFDSFVISKWPITAMITEGDRSAIKSVISGISASGNTAIGEAAAFGLTKLLAASTPDEKRFVFLLSDGANNVGRSPLSVVPDYLEAGIPLFTFAFGPDSDPVTLGLMAYGTGGSFNSSPTNLAKLTTAFLSANQSAQSIPGLAAGSMSPTAGAAASVSVPVDSSLDHLRVSVVFGSAASSTTFSLRRPNGQSVASSDFYEVGAEKLLFFDVPDPETGAWELRADAAAAGTTFTYNASGVHAGVGIDVSTGLQDGGASTSQPGPVILQSKLFRRAAIARATTECTVRRPNDTLAVVELKDDGVFPDELADDGNYAGTFYHSGRGVYSATVQFSNAALNARETHTGATGSADVNGNEVPMPADVPIVENFVRSETFQFTVETDVINVAPAFAVHPADQTVPAGGSISFYAGATAAPAPSYQWQRSTDGGTTWTNLADGSGFSGATTSTLNLTAAALAQDTHRFRLVASNSADSINSQASTLTVIPSPTIMAHPESTSVGAGQAVTLNVVAVGNGTITSQWRLNGVDIAGATGATYSVPSTQRFHTGAYTVHVTAGGSSVTSNAATLAINAPPPNNARLLNLSTRAQALTGDDVLIPGFVVAGAGNKRLLIRAVGPTLGKPPFGLAGVLPDPRMRLLKRNPVTTLFEEIAANDNWGIPQGGTTAADITAAAASVFAFPFNDSLEAALLMDVAPGEYTVIASGVNNTTGIAIVELYDADSAAADARLINISNRGFAGVGDQVMIPGFVVSSEGPKTLLVRVVGPTLGTFGVAGTMGDPKLDVFPGGASTPILTNDNWGDNPDAAYTAQIATQVFAFPLTAGSNDAAFVVTLPPGGYTVIGSSAVAGGTGVVLVEVYVVP